MIKIITSIIIIISLLGCDSNSTDSSSDINMSAAMKVVNKSKEFYNLHDFEKFIELYDEDVGFFIYPDKLLDIGTGNMTTRLKPRFANKSTQVEIVSQINYGNYVINHEIITENGVDAKYISIYEVKEGLIKSVRTMDSRSGL